MPLIRYNGGFLRAPGGGFARTLDCCCAEDPPPCECCDGPLPNTLTVSWTYDGVDYSFDVSVTAAGACGDPITWWLIEPTMNNMFPNCGPCGLFLADFFGDCIAFDLHNIGVVHTCATGWSLVLYWQSGTFAGFNSGGANVCELPVSLTNCGITYTISAA